MPTTKKRHPFGAAIATCAERPMKSEQPSRQLRHPKRQRRYKLCWITRATILYTTDYSSVATLADRETLQRPTSLPASAIGKCTSMLRNVQYNVLAHY